MKFNIKEKFSCYKITSESDCYYYKSKFLSKNSTIQDKDGDVYASLTEEDDGDYKIKALHKSYTYTGILYEPSTNVTIESSLIHAYKSHSYYKYNNDGTKECVCKVSIEPKLIKNFQVEVKDTDHKFALLVVICAAVRSKSMGNRGPFIGDDLSGT